MSRLTVLISVLLLTIISVSAAGCTAAMDEKVRESVRVPGLDESVQARDRALKQAVEGNILSDLELRWYAQTYQPFEVEVSHTVATVYMKVKTEDQRDRVLEMARSTQGITDVVDNIEVDPTLDSVPFEL